MDLILFYLIMSWPLWGIAFAIAFWVGNSHTPKRRGLAVFIGLVSIVLSLLHILITLTFAGMGGCGLRNMCHSLSSELLSLWPLPSTSFLVFCAMLPLFFDKFWASNQSYITRILLAALTLSNFAIISAMLGFIDFV